MKLPPIGSTWLDREPRERRTITVIRYDAEHAADDAVLVRKATTGDQGAFSLLYSRYARMIHGLLLARVPAFEQLGPNTRHLVLFVQSAAGEVE